MVDGKLIGLVGMESTGVRSCRRRSKPRSGEEALRRRCRSGDGASKEQGWREGNSVFQTSRPPAGREKCKKIEAWAVLLAVCFVYRIRQRECRDAGWIASTPVIVQGASERCCCCC